eukprot:GHVL01033841.1.p1 GENE.GHVL01033841.1~~GHVL01033841.1.p1  ORF type:complete len:351 (+),score=47.37 GHVL01033841.1:3411-4463(+)
MKKNKYFVKSILTISVWLFFSNLHAVNDKKTVTINDVNKVVVRRSMKVPAVTVSLNHINLESEVSGSIKKINVRTGDQVNCLQTLLQVNNQDYKLQLVKDKSQLEIVKEQLKFEQWKIIRLKQLAEEDNISQEELLSREAELNKLQYSVNNYSAQISATQLNINRCLVKAPFAGIVTDLSAQLGMRVSPGIPLVRIVDVNAIEVEANLINSEINSLIMQRSNLNFCEHKCYPVKLRTIVNVKNPKNQRQLVRFTFIDGKFIPGTFGNLRWTDKEVYLPEKFLVRRSGKIGVFSADNYIAKFIELPNAIEGQSTIISLNKIREIKNLVIDGRYSLMEKLFHYSFELEILKK